ncbi:MAG: hypothetical protein ACE5I3_02750 [Phycisphaerae bacterium]
MSNARHPERSEPVRSNARVPLAACPPVLGTGRQAARGTQRDRCPVPRGLGNSSSRRRAVYVASLFVLPWGAGVAGCRPSGTAAEPPAKLSAEPGPAAPPAKRPNPWQAKPVFARTSETLPSYVLPFEARANPFAPPKPEPNDRPAATATVQAADVKLVGLMKGGTKGSMAVVEVDGKEFIVFAGARLGSPSGADGLHIVEIRESDIVVEQSGTRWIVPLPRP